MQFYFCKIVILKFIYDYVYLKKMEGNVLGYNFGLVGGVKLKKRIMKYNDYIYIFL